MQSAGQLMTFDEVCARFRKSPAQLRWMIHSRTIVKPAKIGGRLMWKADQVEAFIEAQFADSERTGSSAAS